MTSDAVLLGQHDRFVAAGLRRVLTDAGFAVLGPERHAEAVVGLAARSRPALAVIDVDLPGGGLLATRAVAAASPATRLVVLTGSPGGEELVDAALAGAVGYLRRDLPLERWPDVLHGVLAGETAFPRVESRHLVEALRGREAQRAMVEAAGGASLTDREWEVLVLIADGVPTGEAARRLGISAVTARRHVSSAVAKLGVEGRAEAIALLQGRSRS